MAGLLSHHQLTTIREHVALREFTAPLRLVVAASLALECVAPPVSSTSTPASTISTPPTSSVTAAPTPSPSPTQSAVPSPTPPASDRARESHGAGWGVSGPSPIAWVRYIAPAESGMSETEPRSL